MDKIIQITDSIHGTLPISQLEKDIISQHVFNRLHNILQNSTVYLTYPSNQTKRFEHSLGVMHLGGRMFYHSIVNAEQKVRDCFLAKAEDEIKKIIEKQPIQHLLRDHLGSQISRLDQMDKIILNDALYQTYTPSVIQSRYRFIYHLLFQSVRCVALLHDVGHPPFSHITESALNEIRKNIQKIPSDKWTIRQRNFMEILEELSDGKKEAIALHEKIGNKIADRLLEYVVRLNKSRVDNKDIESIDRQILYLLVHQITLQIINENNEFFNDIHRLIDGILDCDRLDYVTRDLTNSGINQGQIEYDRLINSMALMKYKQNFLFCCDSRTLSTIEDFFQKRWFLYKYVIFHHRVVKTDELLKKIILHLSEKYLQNSKKENKTHDHILPLDISGLWKAIKDVNSDDKYFNALIQWDDAWLLAVLRKDYFSNYYGDDKIISKQLEEFLSNKKNYRSLIKRMNDFSILDEVVLQNLNFDWSQILEKAKAVGTLILPLQEQKCLYEKDYSKWKRERPRLGFFLTNIKNLFVSIQEKSEFEQAVQKAMKTVVNEQNIKDAFLTFKHLKTGMEDSPFIKDKTRIIQLGEVSRLRYDLSQNQKMFPLFFVYIYDENGELDQDSFIKKLGKEIAVELGKLLPKVLS